MSVRDLIPWGRQTSSSSQAPVPYRESEMTPFFGLRREIDRLFDDMFRMPSFAGVGTMTWPSLEVSDNDREVRVSAEIPGLNEKDVELTVHEGVLTIRGEKKSEAEDNDRGYSERWYGRFERRIALPSGVEEDKAEASFRDGVLTVTLPKSAEATSGRRIPINAETRH
jgi:HSP20 family protein